MLSNDVDTGGGASIGGDAKTGRDLTGRDSQSQRAGDTYYGGQGGDDNRYIFFKMLEMAGDIQALSIKIDDIPGRVGRLERTEVVVRPGPEVIVRPLEQPGDSINLSVKAVIIILAVALLLVLILVVILVVIRV